MVSVESVPVRPLSGSGSRRFSVGVVLALVSFVVYACTIWTLPQVRDSHYCCEQMSVAAAVSKVRYGSPLGTLYPGVYGYLIAHFDEPLEQTLHAMQAPVGGLPAQPLGELWKTTRDGNGVGYPLIATVAFRLLGMHTWALQVIMLALMGLSATAFLLRFRRAYSAVVILYFAALTAMLFTPLVWDPQYATQIPVGGIRYFSLVSVLPIFHILLELFENGAVKTLTRTWSVALLGLQTAILVLAMLVRGSALALIGAIALVALTLAYRYWRDRRRLRTLRDNIAIIGGAGIAVFAVIAASVPSNYLTEGRFGTIIWDRVLESLGTNPAFPFPGLNGMFDCKMYVPEGLQSGMPDSNGACVWDDYLIRHNIPVESANDKTLGGQFETVMRDAFFRIARHYPVEVLKTFVYYKPVLIVRSIQQSLRLNFFGEQRLARFPERAKVVPYSALSIGLLVASFTCALLFFFVANVPTSELRRISGVALLSALFTLPSYLAVWALPHTSGDLLLYCLFAAGLTIGVVIVYARQAISGSSLHSAVSPHARAEHGLPS